MKKSSLPQGVDRVVQTGSVPRVMQSGQPAVAPVTSLRISVSQLTTRRWSLLEEVIELRAQQIDGIGLWRPKVADIGEDLAADLIQDAGLSVSSLSFVGGFTGVNGLSFDDAIADARDALAHAELLGAENVIVVSGARNRHTVRHSRRLLREALLELADDAGARGVRLCVLPMHASFAGSWTYLNSLDETVELLSGINHPHVGLAFDTYQLWTQPELLSRIPQLARLTGVVQISDAKRPPQGTLERCLPGEGVIPLGEIVRAFHLSGFDGYYDVQVWSGCEWSGDYSATVSQSREAILRLADLPVAMTR